MALTRNEQSGPAKTQRRKVKCIYVIHLSKPVECTTPRGNNREFPSWRSGEKKKKKEGTIGKLRTLGDYDVSM